MRGPTCTPSISRYQFLVICGLWLAGISCYLHRRLGQSSLISYSDIATASIGPRSTVATGPEELEAAKWELEADTERFIQAAEVH